MDQPVASDENPRNSVQPVPNNQRSTNTLTLNDSPDRAGKHRSLYQHKLSPIISIGESVSASDPQPAEQQNPDETEAASGHDSASVNSQPAKRREPAVQSNTKIPKRPRYYAALRESSKADEGSDNDKVNPPANAIAHTDTNASARSTSSVFTRYFSTQEKRLSSTSSAPAHFSLDYSMPASRSMKKLAKKRDSSESKDERVDGEGRGKSLKKLGRAIWPRKRSDGD